MKKISWCILAAAAAMLSLLAGCRGGAGAKENPEDRYFPAPPDPARVQFLRSFSGSIDFRKERRFLEYLAGSEEHSDYRIEKPFSVATTRGKIYATDNFGLQGLNVFDLERQRFYVIGRTPGPGELRKPINVFADAEGYKFICDLQRRQVLVYGPDDSYQRSYGDGSSFLPVACAAHGGEVYILDAAKDKVKAEGNEDGEVIDEVRRDQILVLDRQSGKPLRRIGQHGSDQQGFSFASFLAVDRLGNLYVSDFLNHRVVKLDPRGNVLLSFGRHGDRAGDFSKMKGIAVDPEGLIYVVDAEFNRVQVFDNAGVPLFTLGGPKAPLGSMELPAGIWIDRENLDRFRDLISPDFDAKYLIIVANQLTTKNSISVYAYGQRRGVVYPTEKIATLEAKETRPLWQLPVVSLEGAEAVAGPKPDEPGETAGAPR